MDKPAVLVDIDNTIFPLNETVLERYNNYYNDNVKFEDIKDYDTHIFLKPECKNIYEEFGFWKEDLNVEPYEGCIDILHELEKKNKVYFASASYLTHLGFRDEYLPRYFNFYDHKRLIRIVDKHLLSGAVLIDDYHKNLIGGNYGKILLTMPWNESFNTINTDIIRVFGWGSNSYKSIQNAIEMNKEK